MPKAYIGAVFVSPDKFTLKVFDRNLNVIGQSTTVPNFVIPDQPWMLEHNEFQRSGLAFRVDGSRNMIYGIEIAQTLPGRSGERKGWTSKAYLKTFDFSGKLIDRVSLQIDWDHFHFLGFNTSGPVLIRQDSRGNKLSQFTKKGWKFLRKGKLLDDFRRNVPSPSRTEQIRNSVADWKKLSRMSFQTPYNNNPRWVEIDLSPLTDALTNDLGTAGIGTGSSFGVFSQRTIAASWNGRKYTYDAPDGTFMQYVHLLEDGKILYTDGYSKLSPDLEQYQVFPRPPFSLNSGKLVDLRTKMVKEIRGASYCFPIQSNK